MWILQYSWLHVYWVGWGVGCVWGEGEVGWKKRGWGVVCVGGGGRWGDGGERREVGELCVCGWRWGERREVLLVILFRGGGVQNILEKRHAARGDLSYAFTRGGLGAGFPENFFKMVQPTWKFLKPPVISQSLLKVSQPPLKFINPTEKSSTPPEKISIPPEKSQPLPKKSQCLPKKSQPSRKNLNTPEISPPTPPPKNFSPPP